MNAWQIFFITAPVVIIVLALAAAFCFQRALDYWKERAERAERNLRACLNAAKGEASEFVVTDAGLDDQEEAWTAVCALYKSNELFKSRFKSMGINITGCNCPTRYPIHHKNPERFECSICHKVAEIETLSQPPFAPSVNEVSVHKSAGATTFEVKTPLADQVANPSAKVDAFYAGTFGETPTSDCFEKWAEFEKAYAHVAPTCEACGKPIIGEKVSSVSFQGWVHAGLCPYTGRGVQGD